MRIWLDTDIGSDVDDALALAYLLRRPELELVGISTVFGDVPIRTEIAEALLDVDGQHGIPVVTGLGVPLTQGKRGVMFGHEGKGLLEDPNPQRRVGEREGENREPDADEKLDALTAAVTAAEPDLVVAIGPLTNLGALVRRDIALPPLAIMGGKLTDVMLPGMSEEIPEWNWFCDPVAAGLVVEADHDVAPLVVPVDVTGRTRLAEGDITRLAAGDPLAAALAPLCEHWLDLLDDHDRAEPVVALHDPLTTAVLVERDLCRFEHLDVCVDNTSGATTVRDRALPGKRTRPADASHWSQIEAAVDVDPAAVRDHIMATLVGG